VCQRVRSKQHWTVQTSTMHDCRIKSQPLPNLGQVGSQYGGDEFVQRNAATWLRLIRQMKATCSTLVVIVKPGMLAARFKTDICQCCMLHCTPCPFSTRRPGGSDAEHTYSIGRSEPSMCAVYRTLIWCDCLTAPLNPQTKVLATHNLCSGGVQQAYNKKE
jgi:hypothetical protein